jgi:hypothetical protein
VSKNEVIPWANYKPTIEIGEGATSVIVPSCYPGYVEKRYKHGLARARGEERATHERISGILERARSPLRTPRLFPSHGPSYIMEQVNTDRPLWHEEVWYSLPKELQESLLAILRSAFEALWLERYHMCDVEVYLQPDNTLVMLDFGRVTRASYADTFRLLSAAVVPPAVTKHL